MPRSKRQRQRSHSLLHHYRLPRDKTNKLPSNARIAAVVIDDPYGVPADENAKLLIGKHTDQASEHVRSWVAPAQPKITVIQSLRDDLLAKMFARHQIDQASFRAGRDYQRLTELSQVTQVRAMDVGRLRGSIGATPNIGSDGQRKASKALIKLELKLWSKFGNEGVGVIRKILVDSYTVEKLAAEKGDNSVRHKDFLGQFFRRCLKEMAVILGYATNSAY
jgi:hypothetical protein